ASAAPRRPTSITSRRCAAGPTSGSPGPTCRPSACLVTAARPGPSIPLAPARPGPSSPLVMRVADRCIPPTPGANGGRPARGGAAENLDPRTASACPAFTCTGEVFGKKPPVVRGPPRKPTVLKLLEGNPRRQRLPEAEPIPVAPIKNPPSHL